MVIRYKRMQGFDVWDRAGYDMHGLPIEHATEKELGISGTAAIKEFGVKKFLDECFLGREVHDESWFNFSGLGFRCFQVNYYPLKNKEIRNYFLTQWFTCFDVLHWWDCLLRC